MLNKKEKNVKNYLLDKNIEFSNEDKDIVLNKIKSKINLEVEEKPSFKQKFNLKVVYALVCSLVICVVGFIGIIHLGESRFIDPNYIGKDVESLNLDEGDYCLAYSADFEYEQYNNLISNYKINFEYRKKEKAYIVYIDNNLLFVFGEYKNNEICRINLGQSALDIVNVYNNTYNTSFNEVNLNDNNSGLLFAIEENGIEFYTVKNDLNYSIFVEFA